METILRYDCVPYDADFVIIPETEPELRGTFLNDRFHGVDVRRITTIFATVVGAMASDVEQEIGTLLSLTGL